MTIHELYEAGARAIYEARFADEQPRCVTPWKELPETAREVWRRCFRAAVTHSQRVFAGAEPGVSGVRVKAMETTTEHIARDIREGRFPARSEQQPAAFVAADGSLSVDWVAMILAEYGRVEDGQIANKPFLAVMIAEAVDRILSALVSEATPSGEIEARKAADAAGYYGSIAACIEDLSRRVHAAEEATCGEAWIVHDWEYRDKDGKRRLAGTPERAEFLIASGTKVTALYVRLATPPAKENTHDGE